MSSPLVQTLASSGPVRVSKSVRGILSIANARFWQHYLQRLANSSSSLPTVLEGESIEPTKRSDDAVQAALEIVRVQSAHLSGYNAALSSSLRDGPIRGQAHAFSSKGFENRRVLLIHGTKDTTVNPSYAPQILELLPAETRRRSKLVMIEGAGHDLTLTHPERIGGAMWAWFEGKEERV